MIGEQTKGRKAEGFEQPLGEAYRKTDKVKILQSVKVTVALVAGTRFNN